MNGPSNVETWILFCDGEAFVFVFFFPTKLILQAACIIKNHSTIILNLKKDQSTKFVTFPQLSLPRKVHEVDLFRFNYSWGFIRQRKN